MKKEDASMYCEKCGRENEQGSNFCVYCGEANIEREDAQVAVSTDTAEKKDCISLTLDKRKVAIIGGIIVGIAIVVALCVLLFGSKPVVLNDYLTVSFSGYDTMGEAKLTMNEVAFVNAVKKKLPDTKFQEAYLLLSFGMSAYLSETENLSNGDVIQLKVDIAEELEEFGIKIKYTEEVFVVEGLAEAEVLDLFENVEITYTGCDPYGTAIVKNNSSHPFIRDYVTYSTSMNGNGDLSVDETFKVYAGYSEEKAKAQGYIIQESSKEYVVEKLDEPVKLDIMDHIKVSFDGVEGEGTAHAFFTTDDEFVNRLTVDFDKLNRLSEGDIITMSVTKNVWTTDPLYYGYSFEDCEIEITVPALSHYITDFDQVSQLDMGNLIATANKIMKENAGSIDLPEYSIRTLSDLGEIKNLELEEVIAYRMETLANDGPHIAFVYSLDVVAPSEFDDHSEDIIHGYVYAYIYRPIVDPSGALGFDPEEAICIKDKIYTDYDQFTSSLMYARDLVNYDLDSGTKPSNS